MREESYRNILFLIFILLATGSLLYLERTKIFKSKERKPIFPRAEKARQKEKEPVQIKPPVKKERAKKQGKKKKLAIVIDDFGTSQEIVYMMEDLPREISPSVLPFRQYSKWTAEYLSSKGFEVLLHLPMEPRNHLLQEDKMLTVDMTGKQMKKFLERALDEVPGASGINNHEGSKFTADPFAIKRLLFLLTNRNIFFLDSRTTSQTLAYKLARSMGIKTCKRDIFLDNDHDFEYIKGQWRRFLKKARINGSAIAIGHARPETLEALKELIKKLPPDYTLVRVSQLAK